MKIKLRHFYFEILCLILMQQKKWLTLAFDLSSLVLIFWFFHRRAARLQHFFHQLELHPSLGFIFSDCKEIQKVVVPYVGRVRVSVLIDHPFKLGCIRVSCANVLWLQMLKLAVDIVALAHFLAAEGIKEIRNVANMQFYNHKSKELTRWMHNNCSK